MGFIQRSVISSSTILFLINDASPRNSSFSNWIIEYLPRYFNGEIVLLLRKRWDSLPMCRRHTVRCRCGPAHIEQESTGLLHFIIRVPPHIPKKRPSVRTTSFLVREMGLEPTRHNHTHLKRACLPFQHSRKRLDIIS